MKNGKMSNVFFKVYYSLAAFLLTDSNVISIGVFYSYYCIFELNYSYIVNYYYAPISIIPRKASRMSFTVNGSGKNIFKL
jgi:hypothetical protein